MARFHPRGLLDTTSETAIVIKGLHGLLELVGAGLLLFSSPATISHFASSVTSHELAEDPNDLIASYVLQSAQHLGEGTLVFATLYLVIHGAVNLGLAVALLNNKLWAYKLLIGSLLVFMAYQMYRYGVTHSLWLLLLTVFDALLIWLSLTEYRKQRSLADFV